MIALYLLAGFALTVLATVAVLWIVEDIRDLPKGDA